MEKKFKIIRDNLHGYIEIPQIICSEIIDTPIFQRLKRIEQTSMRSLYPSARHDRFIHSLGVYHLGKKAIDELFSNIKNSNGDLYDKNDDFFWRQHKLLFELACLLHDCAHAPFSHSFEYAYLGKKDSQKFNIIKEELKNSLQIDNVKNLSEESKKNFINNIDSLFSGNVSPHEVFSAIIVAKQFSTPIKNIYISILETVDFNSEHIEFIQRCILGMKYTINFKSKKDIIKKLNFKNCLISLLNSGSFDVDKLDYIIRDSSASGIDNLSVDIDRLLSALTIVEIHDFNNEIEINENIENSIIFKDLDAHVENNNNNICELNLKLSNVKLDGYLKGKLVGEEVNLTQIINGKSNKLHGEIDTDSDNKISGVISKGVLRGSFTGSIISTLTDINIDGSVRCNISGKIQGKIIGKINWKNQGDVTFEIGYKKNALSIIEDTILARNRLFLWTYAHHKVTYVDYLLRNAVLTSLLDESKLVEGLNYDNLQIANNFLEEQLSLESFFDKNLKNYLIDDCDFIMLIKQSLRYNDFSQKYLNRERKNAIWKSYAEYNIFFNDFSSKEREALWYLLFKNDRLEITEKYEEKEGSTSLFNQSILFDFDEKDDFVWIKPSGIKLSKIDVDRTYIDFNGYIRRLKDALVSEKTTEKYADDFYFYLYSSKDYKLEEKFELVNKLKTKVRELIQ